MAILKGNAAFLHKGRYHDYSVMVASVQNSLSVVRGFVNGVGLDIMLDSGSSVSLLRQDIVEKVFHNRVGNGIR